MKRTSLGIAVLAGMNASLSRSLHQPIWSVAAALVSGESFPDPSSIARSSAFFPQSLN